MCRQVVPTQNVAFENVVKFGVSRPLGATQCSDHSEILC